MPDIKFEIVKKIGVLSKATSGWTKELNLVSWNDREPKYDIRDWSADVDPHGGASREARVKLMDFGLAREQDALSAFIYERVNNGVYEAGFATTQRVYDKAVRALYHLHRWDEQAR